MRTLEVTSYIGCPNRCSYCPQNVLLRSYRGRMIMSLADFFNILVHVPYNVRIDFSGFSEIFCHKEGYLMMKLAILKGYDVALYTTLVGFNEECAFALQGLKFAEVVFHQYGGVDLDDFNGKKELFEKEVQKGRVTEITPDQVWSRAGNLFHRKPMMYPFWCYSANRDFDHNVVLPNGDVYLCCMDYGLKHRLGNLLDTDFDNLDRHTIQELSLRDDSECICRQCELVKC